MSSKLQSAIDAVSDGDFVSARELLREVLQEDPESEEAWLWLAETTESERERGVCLRQVLRINPDNRRARQALEGGLPAAEPKPDTPPQQGPEADAVAAVAAAGVASATEEYLAAEALPPGLPAADERTDRAWSEAESADKSWADGTWADDRWAAEEWDEGRRPVWIVLLTLLVAALLLVCALAAVSFVLPQYLGEDIVSLPPVTLDLGGALDLGPTVDAAVTQNAAATVSAGQTMVAEATMAAPATGQVAATVPAQIGSQGTATAKVPATAEPPSRTTDLEQTPLAPLLPDLLVGPVRVELEAAGGCYVSGALLGTRVQVVNAGEGDAAAFAVEVNGNQQVVPAGLAAGSTTDLWLPGYIADGETAVVVDAASVLAEANEENNTFFERLPIPTPPPPCTPEPGAGNLPQPAGVSVAYVMDLLPARITSRSLYSDAPSSFLQVEIDAEGNARVARDLPGTYEEWYAIGGVVYAGEGQPEGLAPFQVVEDPLPIAGFTEPMGVFAPLAEGDRYTPTFPLHSLLWSGVELDRVEVLGAEPVNGYDAVKYRAPVDAASVPAAAWVGEEPQVDLVAAVAAGGDNAAILIWVEPETGAIVKAQWALSLEGGAGAEYTLDVMPADLRPLVLPVDQ